MAAEIVRVGSSRDEGGFVRGRAGRKLSGIRRRSLRGVHTTHYRSQSIPCWPFLDRDSRLRLLNFLFLRLRIVLAWGSSLRHSV